MHDTLDRTPDASLSTLPGAAVLRRTHRLLYTAIGTAIAYSVLSSGSKEYRADPAGALDGNTQGTDAAYTGVTLSLQPSGIAYLAIAVIVLFAIGRVLRRATDEASAIRILDRAALVMIGVVIAWTIVAHISFWSIPLEGIDPNLPALPGVVFGNVRVDVS
ncbi:hypothetical protein ARHIZOSPH14_07200 [Agromyces rhizosphaerae]|uniref:Cell division protein FtsK n=1 Tax=Agromyces rhizosphaerae TaxID=88374 RepID=A0A9W6FQV6_9MICO|nr:hypothetical protein [Agromyces rhizosphaerae]GLI26478.1 hypothetical protein ARHIZOSPH14_07200 [Agromyces rhizosphaerae]